MCPRFTAAELVRRRPHDAHLLGAGLRLLQLRGSPVSGQRVRLFSRCCGAPGTPASAPESLFYVVIFTVFICVSESLLEKINISFVYFSSSSFFSLKNKAMTLSYHLFSFSKKCTSFGLQEEKVCWVTGLLKTLTL